MNSLDRYLNAVRPFLPAAQRDDIVRELAGNLQASLDDREAALGRPLSETETKAVLDAFGSPLVVAGRYRPDKRTLAFGREWIGPALFPLYEKVLAFNLGLTTVAITAIAIGFGMSMSAFLSALLVPVAIQFAIVTAIFCVVQRGLERHPGFWESEDPLGLPSRGDAGTPPGAPRVSRLQSVAQLVAAAIVLAWLPSLRGFAVEAVASAGLVISPVWHWAYLILTVMYCASALQAVVMLVRPGWMRFYTITALAMTGAWVGMVTWLLVSGDWVLTPATSSGSSIRHIPIAAVNRTLLITLLVVAIVSTVAAFFEVRRAVRSRVGA